MLVQSTIAILILVGFESATSLSAETKEPGKNIPKAIILALFVQGVIAYLFEYFCANLMASEKLTGTLTVAATATAKASTKIVTGMDALANSSAPIGDMTRLLGDKLLGGIGFGLMLVMAVTVAIAVIGTTLSCMNTAVRVTNGMAADRELPEFLSFLHAGNKTPHMAIWVLVANFLRNRGYWNTIRSRSDGYNARIELRHLRSLRPCMRMDDRGLQGQERFQYFQAWAHTCRRAYT